MDPHNTELPFSSDKERYWGPVDLYIGGVEHAVLHLLYARFWHKVLYDCGLVHTKEPFKKLFNQGMIIANAYRSEAGKYFRPEDCERRRGDTTRIVSAFNGESVETDWYHKPDGTPVEQKIGKMGKSLNNSVDPLDIVDQYGADTFRMYEMFMGPLEATKPWQSSGCDGIFRFLSKVWRTLVDEETGEIKLGADTPRPVRKALHVAIQETTEGLEGLKFNTPISKMMEFVNAAKGEAPARADVEDFVKILSPYAPHLGEELWRRLGHEDSIATAPWPAVDPSALVEDSKTYAVQVMGKLRGTIDVPADAGKDAVLAAARSEPNVARFLEGKTIRKEIFVPGRLVNFVAT